MREIEKIYFQTGIRTQALVTTFKLWLVLHTSLISTQSLSRGLISFIEFAKNSDIAKSRLDDVMQEIWKLTQQRNLRCLKPKTIHPRQLVHSFEFTVLTVVKFSITYVLFKFTCWWPWCFYLGCFWLCNRRLWLNSEWFKMAQFKKSLGMLSWDQLS